MAASEDRILDSSETADHKDEDKTNDRVENIQSLPLGENIKKHVLVKNKVVKKDNPQYCQNCGSEIYSSQDRLYCGASCRSKSIHIKKKEAGTPIVPPRSASTPPETVLKIKEMVSSGKSLRTVSSELGVSRSTVGKYS